MPDSGTDKNEENVTFHKPIKIFGRDILEIRCFRGSFICGICTGFVGGLACFLVTSKPLLSTSMSFPSLWVGVIAYWIPCRYQYEGRMAQVHYWLSRKKRKSEDAE